MYIIIEHYNIYIYIHYDLALDYLHNVVIYFTREKQEIYTIYMYVK